MLHNGEGVTQIINVVRKTAFSTLKQIRETNRQQQQQQQQSEGGSADPAPDGKIRNMLLNCVASISKQMGRCTVQQARELLSKSLEATLATLNKETVAQLGAQAADDENPPLVPAPYLPALGEGEEKRYTLVLDLDETLIHYFEVLLLIASMID